jgi:hypothetical protein
VIRTVLALCLAACPAAARVGEPYVDFQKRNPPGMEVSQRAGESRNDFSRRTGIAAINPKVPEGDQLFLHKSRNGGRDVQVRVRKGTIVTEWHFGVAEDAVEALLAEQNLGLFSLTENAADEKIWSIPRSSRLAIYRRDRKELMVTDSKLQWDLRSETQK